MLTTHDALFRLVEQLDGSQWATAQQLQDAQFAHLRRLLTRTARQSPLLARRLGDAGLTPVTASTPAGLLRLPPITRRDIQAAGADLFCREVPPGHGERFETSTSGST